MENTDYQQKNQILLQYCLQDIRKHSTNPPVLALLEIALSKTIKAQLTRPVPPVYAWLLAEDMHAGEEPWTMPLTAACAYFYAAADLYDDIQDNELQQPVLQASSPAQAINIANLLLMAAQQTLTRLPIPAERRLALLELFTETGQTMSVGQFYDIHSTNLNSLEIAPDSIIPKKAGAEFACFMLAVPLAMGQADKENLAEAFRHLGQEVGSLLQIFTDYFDIWVPQGGNRLSQDLAVHKNSFPLYWARADQTWRETVEAWLAGAAGSAGRQLQLRRLLAQTQALESFRDYLESAQSRMTKQLQLLPELPRIQTLWAEECKHSEILIDSLFELRAKTQASPQAFARSLDLTPALQRGHDYLTFIEGYKDAWEVQRWGFLGEPILIGNLFNPLLILETLLDNGHDINPELETLLSRRLEDGWHYYTDSYKIPPDTDDLAQILQLVGRTGLTQARSALEGPLQVLSANLQSLGFCPTWLCDEQRYKREEVDQAWFGNTCPGVMANLYYGLQMYDPHRWHDAVQQGTRALIEQADAEQGGWQGVHYPGYLYASYLVQRLLVKLNIEDSSQDKLFERLLAEQSLDGSWQQQPQTTAFALLLLNTQTSRRQALSSVRLRAVTYLLDAQDYDGSWAGSDLFVRPGRDGAYERFSHPKIATAFVLRALQLEQAVP